MKDAQEIEKINPSDASNNKKNILSYVKNFFKARFNSLKSFFSDLEKESYASMIFMGVGQIMNKQYIKGILYILLEIAFIVYFIFAGITDIVGFFTLGTTKGDAWTGEVGDNSVIMLLRGIFAWIIIIAFISLYISNIKDSKKYSDLRKHGKKVPSFIDDIKSLFGKNFYKTALFLPLIGVAIFNILPIIFMILISFTNYGGTIVPPNLVDWSLESFKKLVVLGELSESFGKILGWNVLWAIVSTFFNYFAGLGLALLYNKKCVKGKSIWRAFPIIAYATPGFITLLAFKFMFSNGGPINSIITQNGGQIIDFLGINSKWMARGIGFFVNAWLTVPSVMLLATGILSNIKRDLYEAAEIDGATGWQQFKSITLPFVIFSTTPVLISQFIGNFNNFGVFFFLRSDVLSEGYFLASDTDLLINWLYRMSIDNNYYAIGAAISLIIFIITSVVSLLVYVRSSAYKKEDTFR